MVRKKKKLSSFNYPFHENSPFIDELSDASNCKDKFCDDETHLSEPLSSISIQNSTAVSLIENHQLLAGGSAPNNIIHSLDRQK